LKRCIFPVSVFGSESTKSSARGYLKGAFVILTKSCSHRAAHVQSGLHLSANGHNCIPDQALQSQYAHQNPLPLHFPGKSIILGGL